MRRATCYRKAQRISKKILKVLALTLFVAGILWTTHPSGGQDEKPFKAVRTVFPSPYRWALGECTTYQLTYSSTSSSDFRVLFGDTKSLEPKAKDGPSGLAFSFDTTVKGELDRTVLGEKGEGYLVAFRMRNLLVTLIANKYNDIQQAEAIRSELEKEVFVVITPQGMIRSVWMDPAMGDLAKSYTRVILALTQFVFPVDQSQEKSRWEIQEEDPSGQYIATYQIYREENAKVTKTSVKSYCKKKKRYLEYPPKTKTGPVEISKTIVPKGKFVAHFDLATGGLSSMRGSESQTILVQNKKVGEATNHFQMELVRKEILKASDVAALKNQFSGREKTTQSVSLFVMPSPEEVEASIHRKQLGDATLESLLAELERAESGAAPNLDTTALYLKFKSLIYLHPESCETLGKVLSRAGAKSLTMTLLPKALSTVGHTQAQAALVKAIKAHSKDINTLFGLINSLATVNKPTEQAEEALRNLAFESKDPDIRAMVQLALGAQSRRIAAFSPERAAKIVDRFIEELKHSSSPEMKKQLLLALGNAGSPRALPVISDFATSSSSGLRATALHAMRFIDSQEAEKLLINALRSDQDNSVRLSAASSLGYRKMTPTSFPIQRQIFLKDSDVNLRLKVLENLWKAHEAFPEVRILVKKAASDDPSEGVRKAAKNIMSQYPESYFK